MPTKKPRRMTFEKSSGNVFADNGFANPEREQLKALLQKLGMRRKARFVWIPDKGVLVMGQILSQKRQRPCQRVELSRC